MVDTSAYLARIGARPDTDLAALQSAHLRAVPFEDYDIHLGIPLSLDIDAVFDKVVRRHRGGFCYELNGLFGQLLRALGHEVAYLSACDVAEDGTRGPDFEHLRLLVDTAEGPTLADVGQGKRWSHPVPLRPGVHGDVRVSRDGDTWTTHRRGPGGWVQDWSFTTKPRLLSDFADRCRYQQYDPASHFRRHRLAWLALPTGRVAITDGVLADTGHPDRALSRAEEVEVLRTRFGIQLPRTDWPS